MGITKEHSRRSGSFKFRSQDNDLAPAQRGFKEPNSAESTAVVEHPRARIAREIESHERVGLLFRHWLSLIIGVSLGVALVIAFQVSSKITTSDEPAQVASAIKVTVLDPNAETGTSSAAPAVQPSEQLAAAASQPEPSNIVEHARTRAVNLEERKFLYTTGSAMRAYESDFLSSDANGEFDFKLGEASPSLSLRPINDSSGRYELAGTNIQWQGSWQADNPEQNIKLGSAYVDYVNRTFGNTVGSNLSAINKEPTSLLNRMPRKSAAPTAMKSYSGR